MEGEKLSSLIRERLLDAGGCLALGIALTGCATSARPIPITPRVALQPNQNEISMQAKPGKAIGDIVPVDVSVANGTDEPYLLVPNQVFAIDQQGQRILPLTPDEAVQEAGDADSLKAGLTGAAKNAGVGLVAGAMIGAAIGVAAGALVGEPGAGAAYGAMMGGGVGAAEGGVLGGVEGQAAAHKDAQTQITSLSLQAQELHPKFSANGFIFFPKGDYQSVQMTLLNEERHESQTLIARWPAEGSAPQAAVAQEIVDTPTVVTPQVSTQPTAPQAAVVAVKAVQAPVASTELPLHNPNADLHTNFDNW